MLKKFFVAFAALSLAACSGIPVSVQNSPAPLAQTTIDDRALETAWKGFDTALDGVNLVLDLKPNLISTPGARRLADAIDATSLALTAAESAAAAGEATDYAVALAKAKQSFVEMRQAIQALKGQ